MGKAIVPAGACQCWSSDAQGVRCTRWTRRWASTNAWICARHWSRLSKVDRRVFVRLRRTAKLVGWDHPKLATRWRRIWWALARRAAG